MADPVLPDAGFEVQRQTINDLIDEKVELGADGKVQRNLLPAVVHFDGDGGTREVDAAGDLEVGLGNNFAVTHPDPGNPDLVTISETESLTGGYPFGFAEADGAPLDVAGSGNIALPPHHPRIEVPANAGAEFVKCDDDLYRPAKLGFHPGAGAIIPVGGADRRLQPPAAGNVVEFGSSQKTEGVAETTSRRRGDGDRLTISPAQGFRQAPGDFDGISNAGVLLPPLPAVPGALASSWALAIAIEEGTAKDFTSVGFSRVIETPNEPEAGICILFGRHGQDAYDWVTKTSATIHGSASVDVDAGAWWGKALRTDGSGGAYVDFTKGNLLTQIANTKQVLVDGWFRFDEVPAAYQQQFITLRDAGDVVKLGVMLSHVTAGVWRWVLVNSPSNFTSNTMPARWGEDVYFRVEIGGDANGNKSVHLTVAAADGTLLFSQTGTFTSVPSILTSSGDLTMRVGVSFMPFYTRAARVRPRLSFTGHTSYVPLWRFIDDEAPHPVNVQGFASQSLYAPPLSADGYLLKIPQSDGNTDLTYGNVVAGDGFAIGLWLKPEWVLPLTTAIGGGTDKTGIFYHHNGTAANTWHAAWFEKQTGGGVNGSVRLRWKFVENGITRWDIYTSWEAVELWTDRQHFVAFYVNPYDVGMTECIPVIYVDNGAEMFTMANLTTTMSNFYAPIYFGGAPGCERFTGHIGFTGIEKTTLPYIALEGGSPGNASAGDADQSVDLVRCGGEWRAMASNLDTPPSSPAAGVSLFCPGSEILQSQTVGVFGGAWTQKGDWISGFAPANSHGPGAIYLPAGNGITRARLRLRCAPHCAIPSPLVSTSGLAYAVGGAGGVERATTFLNPCAFAVTVRYLELSAWTIGTFGSAQESLVVRLASVDANRQPTATLRSVTIANTDLNDLNIWRTGYPVNHAINLGGETTLAALTRYAIVFDADSSWGVGDGLNGVGWANAGYSRNFTVAEVGPYSNLHKFSGGALTGHYAEAWSRAYATSGAAGGWTAANGAPAFNLTRIERPSSSTTHFGINFLKDGATVCGTLWAGDSHDYAFGRAEFVSPEIAIDPSAAATFSARYATLAFGLNPSYARDIEFELEVLESCKL
jgi:hypothetical protein